MGGLKPQRKKAVKLGLSKIHVLRQDRKNFSVNIILKSTNSKWVKNCLISACNAFCLVNGHGQQFITELFIMA